MQDQNGAAPRTGDGFVYVATGRQYIQEAEASCASLKRHMPGAHTSLFTDTLDAVAANCFDRVYRISAPRYNFYDKIYAFIHSPYHRTVFLDTDTSICHDLGDLFQIVDRFDIAATRDQWASTDPHSPLCYDDFNTGVIAFRSQPHVDSVFLRWQTIYDAQIRSGAPVEHDQPSFSQAVYESAETSVYVLPGNYNMRTIAPMVLGHGYLPKVIHGRNVDVQFLQDSISQSSFNIIVPNGTYVYQSDFVGLDRVSTAPFVVSIRLAQALTRTLTHVKARFRRRSR